MSSEYRDRRIRVISDLGEGALILPSNPESTMSNDVGYKYRQHSDLLYLSGYPEPGTTAVIEKTGEEIVFHLFVLPRDPLYETWNGRRYGVEGAKQHFNADFSHINTELNDLLPKILKKHETVFYPQGENADTDEIVNQSIRKARKMSDKTGKGPYRVVNPHPTIHKYRATKSEAEIQLLRKSIRISADAHTRAMKVTKPGISEYQIEAIINYEFRKSGALRPAYETIVAGGINGTILIILRIRMIWKREN